MPGDLSNAARSQTAAEQFVETRISRRHRRFPPSLRVLLVEFGESVVACGIASADRGRELANELKGFVERKLRPSSEDGGRREEDFGGGEVLCCR